MQTHKAHKHFAMAEGRKEAAVPSNGRFGLKGTCTQNQMFSNCSYYKKKKPNHTYLPIFLESSKLNPALLETIGNFVIVLTFPHYWQPSISSSQHSWEAATEFFQLCRLKK